MRKYLAILDTDINRLEQLVVEVSRRLGLKDTVPNSIIEDDTEDRYTLVLSMEVLQPSVVEFFNEQGIDLKQTSLTSEEEGWIAPLENLESRFLQNKEEKNGGSTVRNEGGTGHSLDNDASDIPNVSKNERSVEESQVPQEREEVTKADNDDDEENASFNKIMMNIAGTDFDKAAPMVKPTNEENDDLKSDGEETLPEVPKDDEEIPQEPISRPQLSKDEEDKSDDDEEDEPEDGSDSHDHSEEDKTSTGGVDRKRLKILIGSVAAIAILGLGTVAITSTVHRNHQQKIELAEKKKKEAAKKKKYALSEKVYKQNAKKLADANIGLYLNDDNELSGTITVTTDEGKKRVKKLVEYTRNGEFITEDVETGENYVYSKKWVDKLVVAVSNPKKTKKAS